jgi:hypothetical protein
VRRLPLVQHDIERNELMGLDITAYSKLKYVGKHTDADGCEDENHVSAFAYAEFPASFRGIEVLATKTSGGCAFLYGGCYAITDATQEHDFRAGSYSGYNVWRSDLARQFNPQIGDARPDPDLPFYELIWFADDEGTIGPIAARTLLGDFRSHADRYEPAGDYFREKYADWTTACELAADGGLISFH